LELSAELRSHLAMRSLRRRLLLGGGGPLCERSDWLYPAQKWTAFDGRK
jgi:hypothetical protein